MAQWRAAGGRLHRQRRRRIQPPAEVLPRWHRGIGKGVRNPVARDALRLGLYTGMRHSEVLELRWDMVDFDAMTLTVEETKTGEPLEIPIVRQVGEILERRMAERGNFPENGRVWVFPSETATSGRLSSLQQHNARIGEAGGAKFWFHALQELLHHGGGPGADAADQPDQAAGQPCQAAGRDRGLRVGLDRGPAPRRRATHRRSDR